MSAILGTARPGNSWAPPRPGLSAGWPGSFATTRAVRFVGRGERGRPVGRHRAPTGHRGALRRATPCPGRVHAPQGLADVGAERAGAVGDRNRRLDGQAEHVGAGARPIGDDRDRAGGGDGSEVDRQRQVTVGDHEVIEALARDRRPARFDRSVEAEAWRPEHLGSDRVGPRRHGLVVAGDEDRRPLRCGDDPPGEPLRQPDALAVVEDARQPALGEEEALHRDQHRQVVHGRQDRWAHPYARCSWRRPAWWGSAGGRR